MLLQNRKKFYRNFVFSTSSTSNGTSIIWNEKTQSNTTSPKELKSCLVSEATKILCRPTLPPTNPPEWFSEGYKWNAKGLDVNLWQPLTAKITSSEVRNALKGPPKAPGFDGVTNSILKAVVNDLSTSEANIALKHITRLCNLWYSSGICPELCSIGKMRLIPKTGKKSPTKYSSQRPLTLQPELAKLTLRILATRLQNIFHEHNILHHSQQAYIVGGSVDHCLNLLLNHMENNYSDNKTLPFIA